MSTLRIAQAAVVGLFGYIQTVEARNSSTVTEKNLNVLFGSGAIAAHLGYTFKNLYDRISHVNSLQQAVAIGIQAGIYDLLPVILGVSYGVMKDLSQPRQSL